MILLGGKEAGAVGDMGGAGRGGGGLPSELQAHDQFQLTGIFFSVVLMFVDYVAWVSGLCIAYWLEREYNPRQPYLEPHKTHVSLILCKSPTYSKAPEMNHPDSYTLNQECLPFWQQQYIFSLFSFVTAPTPYTGRATVPGVTAVFSSDLCVLCCTSQARPRRRSLSPTQHIHRLQGVHAKACGCREPRKIWFASRRFLSRPHLPQRHQWARGRSLVEDLLTHALHAWTSSKSGTWLFSEITDGFKIQQCRHTTVTLYCLVRCLYIWSMSWCLAGCVASAM